MAEGIESDNAATEEKIVLIQNRLSENLESISRTLNFYKTFIRTHGVRYILLFTVLLSILLFILWYLFFDVSAVPVWFSIIYALSTLLVFGYVMLMQFRHKAVFAKSKLPALKNLQNRYDNIININWDSKNDKLEQLQLLEEDMAKIVFTHEDQFKKMFLNIKYKR